MTEILASPEPKTRPYRVRGPNTWAAIRECYLGGVTASECAARFNVTKDAVYKRAQRENWGRRHAFPASRTRSIGPESVAGAAAEPAPPEPVETDPNALAREALTLAARAMRAGRAAEAQSLARLAEIVGRLRAATEAQTADEPPPKTQEQYAAEMQADYEVKMELYELIEARAFEYARDMLTGGALQSIGGGAYRPEFVVIDNRVVRTRTLAPPPEPVDGDTIWGAVQRANPEKPLVDPYRLIR